MVSPNSNEHTPKGTGIPSIDRRMGLVSNLFKEHWPPLHRALIVPAYDFLFAITGNAEELQEKGWMDTPMHQAVLSLCRIIGTLRPAPDLIAMLDHWQAEGCTEAEQAEMALDGMEIFMMDSHEDLKKIGKMPEALTRKWEQMTEDCLNGIWPTNPRDQVKLQEVMRLEAARAARKK